MSSLENDFRELMFGHIDVQEYIRRFSLRKEREDSQKIHYTYPMERHDIDYERRGGGPGFMGEEPINIMSDKERDAFIRNWWAAKLRIDIKFDLKGPIIFGTSGNEDPEFISGADYFRKMWERGREEEGGSYETEEWDRDAYVEPLRNFK